MLVLSSPSGAGKTTLSKKLVELDSNLIMSTSYTTRTKRVGEKDGEDYHFVEVGDFKEMIGENQLLEYALVFGNYYGTPRLPVEKYLAQGKDVVFDIDWQGAQQLAQQKGSVEDVVSIFILPPSASELESRLKTRNQDSISEVESRMSQAASELSHYDEYNYIMVNNEIEESIKTLKAIVKAERLKTSRQTDLHKFVESLKG
ncbi:MAG: guanylate kinase [Rhodospirillaceae bacterium]|nr:guanylate kinase [Rhodospirillaceae bacterium]